MQKGGPYVSGTSVALINKGLTAVFNPDMFHTCILYLLYMLSSKCFRATSPAGPKLAPCWDRKVEKDDLTHVSMVQDPFP